MLWLVAGPVLVFLLSLAVLLPYASLRTAVRNTRRADGHRSRQRTQRELHHLRRFLRSAALVPLLVLILLQSGLYLVHTYVVPDTTLSELFGEYHPETSLHAPDLEAWNEAIDADRRDRDYEAWREAQGLAPASTTPMAEVLVEHWPLHLAFLILPLAYFVWFVRRRYLPAARTYHRGVTRREKRYALRAGDTSVLSLS
jgi:hypothetical protein